MKVSLSYLNMLLFLLCAAAFTHYVTHASERESVPQRTSLTELPQQVGSWQLIDTQALDAGQLRELRADDYISRIYANNRGSFAYLFIVYYDSQRHRQTIHSPQNCMPGAGWTMGAYRLHSLPRVSSGEIENHPVSEVSGKYQINEYRIEKDDVKMLTFYWYHGRGRATASEYLAKFYTIKDAVVLGRTDGALVRVIVPVGKGDGAEEQSRTEGLEFSRHLLGMLSSYIPD